MPTVTLPPGCSGFNMTDGTEYKGRPGGSVTVADEHAPHIRRQTGGDAGLTGHGSFRSFMATKAGRWCAPCRRLWNAWNTVCVKCGEPTVPEAEMPAAGPSLMPSACVVPIAPRG